MSWFSMTCRRERHGARDVGQTAVGNCLALIWTRWIVCVDAQLPCIGMFRGSMGGMARDGYSSAKSGQPIGWSMSLA